MPSASFWRELGQGQLTISATMPAEMAFIPIIEGSAVSVDRPQNYEQAGCRPALSRPLF